MFEHTQNLRNETLEDYERLWSKSVWGYREVMLYAHCGQTKAYLIIGKARSDYGGATPLGEHKATADSILAMHGTTRRDEMDLYRRLKND